MSSRAPPSQPPPSPPPGGAGVGRLAPPENLTAELVRRLAVEIRTGRLRPQDRLPTEQALMREAGVSRTVVREAVAALRAEGLVITRQGLGAFVADPNARPTVRIEPGELRSVRDVLDVIDLRIAIETEAAGLAAARRDAAAIARINAAHATFEEAVAQGLPAVPQDLDFHRAVFAATGNSMFPRFLEFLGPLLIPRQTLRPPEQTAAARGAYLAGVTAEHARIAAAIAAGAPSAARLAMRRHLTASRDRYGRLAESLVFAPG